MDTQSLQVFIVTAKAATYVGSGHPAPSCRPGSHDLQFGVGEWSYLDSYFGGRDFLGEEVVFYRGKAVWAENYYGHILRPELITPAQAGQVIKASLSRLYASGRFLGGFNYQHEGFVYMDGNEGEMESFLGREWITRAGETAYELFYHGGLIRDA